MRSPADGRHAALRDHFDRAAGRYRAASLRWPWSWQRRREARAVLALAGTLAGRSVLDLGSGAGFYSRLFLDQGARPVVAVDASLPMAAAAAAQGALGVRGDARSVAFRRRFDVVVAAGLLEFVEDPAGVLRHAASAIEEAGPFVLLVPSAGLAGRAYRAYHRSHGVGVRLFAREDLRALADATGWTVEDERWVWPYTLVARLRGAR
jgi:SAM-dependent methyltransferase